MRPHHSMAFAASGGDRKGAIKLSRLFRQLHGVFSDIPETYAVALAPTQGQAPCGLRVFASSDEELERLLMLIEAPELPPGDIRPVPEGFCGPWLKFTRYRIPTRSQERHSDGTLRERRLREADARALPWINMHSTTNGSAFRLYIDVKQGAPQLAECAPNSYGLASEARDFSLPMLDYFGSTTPA